MPRCGDPDSTERRCATLAHRSGVRLENAHCGLNNKLPTTLLEKVRPNMTAALTAATKTDIRIRSGAEAAEGKAGAPDTYASGLQSHAVDPG